MPIILLKRRYLKGQLNQITKRPTVFTHLHLAVSEHTDSKLNYNFDTALKIDILKTQQHNTF